MDKQPKQGKCKRIPVDEVSDYIEFTGKNSFWLLENIEGIRLSNDAFISLQEQDFYLEAKLMMGDGKFEWFSVKPGDIILYGQTSGKKYVYSAIKGKDFDDLFEEVEE